MVLYRQMAVDSVGVTALYIQGDLCFPAGFVGELLRVSGSAPRHAIRALLLMRGDPLLYIHLFVDSVGVMVLYRQIAVDSVGVTALYIHGDLLSVRFNLSFCGFRVRIALPPRPAIRALLLFYAAGGITLRVYLVQVGRVMRFFLTGGGGKRGRIGRRRGRHIPGVKTPVPCDAGRAKAKALAYPEARTTTTGRTRAGQGDPRLKPWATSHVLPGSDGDGWRVTVDTWRVSWRV
jgi:hypothetical protein